ncbi:MocR-like pyridoxine biosynthesis transcription factor PdxR [Myxosarcina sp. GI1(2024)]
MLHIDLDKTPKHLPYYLQISEQIRDAISSGKLTSGTRLPSSRQLAFELNIARQTVVIAYEELCSQGYCTSTIGHGTFVAQIPVVQQKYIGNTRRFPDWLLMKVDYTFRADDQNIDKICFTPSLAQNTYLPFKAMRQTFNRMIRQTIPEFNNYKKDSGDLWLIQALCQRVLPARGIQAEPNQILITHGSQHSSSLLSMLLAPYGGSITYGVPGYLSIPRNFTIRGIKGIACPIDSEGMYLTEDAYSARVHYVMPEHHFPVGVTLSPRRRSALLQLAEEQDALIIEDDYDSEFYYNRHPLPALKSDDLGGRVVYLGTFSKSLFNSLRLGYIVAHPEIIRCLVDIRWQLDGGTSLILQRWVAELLKDGAVERHQRRMRIHYRKKRDLIATYLRELFPKWSWQLPSGGMQFWIKLPSIQPAEELIYQAAERRVGLWSGATYYEPEAKREDCHLVLGYGAITESEIHQAFNRLRGLIH